MNPTSILGGNTQRTQQTGPIIVPQPCIYCDIPDVTFSGWNIEKSPPEPEVPAMTLKVLCWFVCANGHKWGQMTWHEAGQAVRVVLMNAEPNEQGQVLPLNWEDVTREKLRLYALTKLIVPGRRPL